MSKSPAGMLEDLLDTRDTVMVAFGGFTVLVWDHIITFDDEVEFVWKRKKGLMAYLFLLNRYLTPLGFIVNLVAYTLPNWGIETFEAYSFAEVPTHHAISCEHFVRYEGAMTVVGTQVAGIIMFLRVCALYYRNTIVIGSITLLFFIWLGANAWLLTHGEAVYHPSGVHSCTMIFDTSLSYIASASAWLPLLYDTSVFVLTIYKTKHSSGPLFQTLMSDGILYYSVLCMVNTVLTIMIARAGPGVKNIAAQLELLLTVAIVSRISLNLRKQTRENTPVVFSTIGTFPRLPPTTYSRSGSLASIRKAVSRRRANTAPSITPRLQNRTAQIAETRSRASTVGSSIPRHFQRGPEHIRLNPIYSVSLTSVVGEEAPRVPRPIGKDVEAGL